MVVQKLQIGNVDLDLRRYSGSDAYSDGDIEDELLRIVKNTEDYDAVLSGCENFSIYYHLAKERGFITDVMEISEYDEVLEIGAGCGAVTGALAERRECRWTAICLTTDLSRRRSMRLAAQDSFPRYMII